MQTVACTVGVRAVGRVHESGGRAASHGRLPDAHGKLLGSVRIAGADKPQG